MRIGIVIGLLTVVCTIRFVHARHTYFYEKLNHFGLGKPIMRNRQMMMDLKNTGAHPEPLPPPKKSPMAAIPSPYKTLYQGTRVLNDSRVFRRRFNFEPLHDGHQILCEGLFDCTLTHLAIETSEAIPYIIRGGAGYRHFTVVVKARPGNALRGSVRAYCRQKDIPVVEEKDNNGRRQRRRKPPRFSESNE